MDLAFIDSEIHRLLLQEAVERACGDTDVTGVLLVGSVARGDAYPGSDLDVYVLLRDGCSRSFRSEVRQGIIVEHRYADYDHAAEEMERNPMRVYAYLDGHILYDPEGQLARLVNMARARLESYETPGKEKHKIAYWLESARYKMIVAREAGDLLQAAYVVSTASWPILEGLWAANDKPMPPNGAVRAHIRDLSRTPPALEDLWHRFFAGDVSDRIQAAIELIDWVVPVLEG
jgi:predicted nucleotidyltransferase